MRTKLLLFTVIIICLSFTNLHAQKIWKESIPPDFNCAGCILVIIKKEPKDNVHKINEMIEKNLIKNYEGKSVFITAEDAYHNPLYADTSVYRFLLDNNVYGVSESQYIEKGAGRTGKFNYTMSALNMHIYDRFTRKGYGQLSNWPSWAKNMEKIAEALNKELKK